VLNADDVDLYTIEICAGVGMLGEGLRAGLAHLGITHRTIAYLEREAYAASVLAARMEDGSLDGAPIWPDLLTFDGRAWRGAVDCIAAGFPCQDLSLAGRRAGLDGARSGLFFNIVDIADACGARFLFLENVAGIASATASVMDEAEGALEERAAARVLGELADRGWDAEWLTLSASEVGASHGRARWFCFAWRGVAHASFNGAPERPQGDASDDPRVGASGCADHSVNASADMGHTGLQHQHLQQRQDGAEHPGAGQPVAYAQLPKRRALSVCGNGSQQGHDGGRREAHGGAGIADAVVGNPHQQRQQQPHDTDSAQPRGNARACSGGTSCELADTQRIGSQRRGITGDVARTGGDSEGETRPWQRGGFTADGDIGAMAHPSSPRPQRRELGTTRDSHRGGAGSTWIS